MELFSANLNLAWLYIRFIKRKVDRKPRNSHRESKPESLQTRPHAGQYATEKPKASKVIYTAELNETVDKFYLSLLHGPGVRRNKKRASSKWNW